jgi:hypothetical protein
MYCHSALPLPMTWLQIGQTKALSVFKEGENLDPTTDIGHSKINVCMYVSTERLGM